MTYQIVNFSIYLVEYLNLILIIQLAINDVYSYFMYFLILVSIIDKVLFNFLTFKQYWYNPKIKYMAAFEFFYLGFLNRYIDQEADEMYLKKKNYLYYPRMVILVDFLFNGDSEILNSIFYISLATFILQFILKIYSVLNEIKILKEYDIYELVYLFSAAYKLVVILFVTIRCSTKDCIIYFTVVLVLALMKFIYINFKDINKDEFKVDNVLKWIVFSIGKYDSYQNYAFYKKRVEIKITSMGSINHSVIKSFVFIFLLSFSKEKRQYLLSLLFQTQFIIYHLKLLQGMTKIIQRKINFKSIKEIKPFLQQYEKYNEIVVVQESSQSNYNLKKQLKTYQIFQEDSEDKIIQQSKNDEMDLLRYLYNKLNEKKSIIIDQYNLQVSDNQFIVHKIADISTISEFLYDVKVVPESFLPPMLYLGSDLMNLKFNRALMFLPFQNYKKKNQMFSQKENNIFQQATSQSFQILTFFKTQSLLININPAQVLYDLYEYN